MRAVRGFFSGAHPREFFPELESLRGLATLYVFVWHWFSLAAVPAPWFTMAYAVLYNGAELIALTFYVLSGFVLTHVLARSAPEAPDLRGLRDFFVRRAFRLFPFGMFAILAMVAVAYLVQPYYGPDAKTWAHFADFSMRTIALDLVLYGTEFNAVGWTLKYEIVGYVLIPLAFVALRARDRRALVAVGAIAALHLLVPLSLFPTWPHLAASFGCGALLYFASARVTLGRRGQIFLVALIGLVLWYRSGQAQHYERATVTALAVAAAFWLLLAKPSWQRALALRPIRWVGRVSYSVYLFHYPILWYITARVTPTLVITAPLHFFLLGAIAFPATFLIARFTHRYVEEPAARLGVRLTRSRRAAPSAEAPAPLESAS